MEDIDVGKQLESAIAAVTALADAKVGVIAVTLSRETNKPHILVDASDAEKIILKDQLIGAKPATYDYRTTPQGFISETWKVGFLGCVVWFSFLTIPKSMKTKNDGPRLN